MECVGYHSSAVFSSPSQISVAASIPEWSSSGVRSSVQLWSQNSRTLRKCLYLRSCIPSTKFSTALLVSGTASPFQTENAPSSSGNPADEASASQDLSAKERRKLRNLRREEAKSSQQQPWREVVENRLLQKRKKIRGWDEDADINQCIAKGVRWWMIQTTRTYEFEVAEQISIIFPERFPGREFEVLVPTVPVRIKLKDGSVSLSRKKLYQGIVLLRCLLDRDVHFMVKKVPRAYEFFGNWAGLSLQPVIMPAPVSNFTMDNMFQRIRKEEEEYENFKEHCRKEVEEQSREEQRKKEEQQRTDLEQNLFRSKGLVLEVGATVRVLSGPFLEFTGLVVELLPKVNQIRVLVTVFGNDTQILLDVEDVVVEAAAVDR